MKKMLLLFLSLLAICVVHAQIQKIVEPQINEDVSLVFDSTKNLIRPRTYHVYDPAVQAFVGQKLYLKPLEEGKRKDGYLTILTLDYDPNRPPYLFRYGEYEKLAEKTFEVVKVDTFLTAYNKYIFTLKMIEDESIMCKYVYDGESYSFPFVTMSYYNYLCNLLLDKKFVISNYMFKDKPFEEQKKAIFSELEWNKLVKQYGLNMMKIVLAQKIQVGMPEKLVRYSWGSPERINRSSYGSDQWVYDGRYLYLRNGKVESWN